MADSDQVLTQEEIDAMLSGAAPAPAPSAEAVQAAPPAPAPAPPAAAQAPQPVSPPPPRPAAGTERLDRLEQSIAGVDSSVRQLQQYVQELAAQLQLVSRNLEGTIGKAAHETFTCSSCQTIGQVATRLTCTSCGTENWWGWYPPQE